MSKKIKEIENYIINNQEYHYRIAYSYVHNKDEAFDIVQSSIVKSLTSHKRLKDTRLIKTWFYKILVNTALDYLRKNKRIVYVDDDYLANKGTTNTDTYKDEDIDNALNELPLREKTVITLKYFEDLRIKDIAFILDEKENTIKSRLYSGIKKLKSKMNQEDY